MVFESFERYSKRKFTISKIKSQNFWCQISWPFTGRRVGCIHFPKNCRKTDLWAKNGFFQIKSDKWWQGRFRNLSRSGSFMVPAHRVPLPTLNSFFAPQLSVRKKRNLPFDDKKIIMNSNTRRNSVWAQFESFIIIIKFGACICYAQTWYIMIVLYVRAQDIHNIRHVAIRWCIDGCYYYGLKYSGSVWINDEKILFAVIIDINISEFERIFFFVFVVSCSQQCKLHTEIGKY